MRSVFIFHILFNSTTVLLPVPDSHAILHGYGKKKKHFLPERKLLLKQNIKNMLSFLLTSSEFEYEQKNYRNYFRRFRGFHTECFQVVKSTQHNIYIYILRHASHTLSGERFNRFDRHHNHRRQQKYKKKMRGKTFCVSYDGTFTTTIQKKKSYEEN